MNYDDIKVNLISDGTLMVDGGYAFGQVPRTEWETQIKPDRRNRVRFAMNSMVIQTPTANILVDTGVGSKRTDELKESHHINGNKLIRNLKEFDSQFKKYDFDPYNRVIKNSTVFQFPDSLDGERVGHTSSLYFSILEIVN